MCPLASLNKSVTESPSAQATRYVRETSLGFPKRQVFDTQNAQTERETHLSQNTAHSSRYGPSGKQCVFNYLYQSKK